MKCWRGIGSGFEPGFADLAQHFGYFILYPGSDPLYLVCETLIAVGWS